MPPSLLIQSAREQNWECIHAVQISGTPPTLWLPPPSLQLSTLTDPIPIFLYLENPSFTPLTAPRSPRPPTIITLMRAYRRAILYFRTSILPKLKTLD